MRSTPPLAGLRVLELACGVAGPYAGRLLALLGAEVVKVEPDGGDPARAYPVDDRPLSGTSPLFLHLNAGKRSVRRSRADLARLLDWAQMVLDDRVRRELEGADPDPRRARLLVSVTPWGFESVENGGIADELLVQASSGAMLADPESRTPRRFPGWQAQVHAGAYAAAGALAGLALGSPRHIDVAWVSCLLAGVEGTLTPELHERGRASRPGAQAGVQANAFPAGVFRCADGFVIPGTVRPIDWTLQCQLYGQPELVDDPRFDRRSRFENRDVLRSLIQPWYDARGKREIFRAALDSGWAAAMVLTARDALADEHLRERGFLGEALDCATGRKLVLAAAPWRTPGLPVANTRVAALGENDEEVQPVSEPPARLPTLAGLRVLELTRAWAGPFVGRFLGALGADVVKVEGARSPDGWRARLRMKYAGIDVPDGIDPATYTWDASALYNSLNRNKRHLSLDLTRPEARELFLELAGVADVLIVNMTHRVLADFGLEYPMLSARNPRLVLVNLPALGASGPYRAMPGYGILIEGMGGFAARYGSRDEPARTTATYYPDPVAGIHATVAALAALAARERTGRGSQVDLSQQEAMWLQLGEGLALASLEGREIDRLGDAEPGQPGSGIEHAASGSFATLGPNGPRRAVTDFRVGLPPELVALDPLERLSHPLTGARTYLRVPLRIDGAPIASSRPAPVFDQHSDAIVAHWIGASAQRIASLRAEGTLGGRPGDLPALVSNSKEEPR